jgi:prepilin-type N-terminal cleavage/methylation domain-containing protein
MSNTTEFKFLYHNIMGKKKESNRTKAGYTLNEIVITIAIVTIISSFLVKGFLNYKIYLNRMDVEYCNNSIMNLLNGAKGYCRNKGVNGYIFFDGKNGVIYFMSGKELVDKYSIPSKFKLNNVNLGTGKYAINIDVRGFTSDACTISYQDREGSTHKITICVGTSYVEIKDK